MDTSSGKWNWSMSYSTHDQDFGRMRVGRFDISDATEDEAIATALAFIKRRIRRMRKGRIFIANILLPDPREGMKAIPAESMLRIKTRYSNRQLLRIRKPRTCFVKGYGPEAHEKVYGQ